MGRFTVLHLLGEGGQGKVHLAHDPHLDRQVAIKTVSVEGLGDARDRTERLIAEARIVSKMQHPNIVALFDAGSQGNVPYLVFEYVQGKTLAEVLAEGGAMPILQAVEFTRHILAGVAYAHRQNVVHCDLKPGNIMIDAAGVPRIMDFGIAKSLRGGASHGQIVGTPAYLAPESVRRQSYSPSSDLYAVGILLYEMLTGERPFRGDDVESVLAAVLGGTIEPPSARRPQVDEKLDHLVLRATGKRPEDRFATAEDFIAALDDYLAPRDKPAAETSRSTLDFLLRRMRHKSDFPALSQAISAINRIAASDQESVSALSNVILRDFSLTNKLLKLVNTACYGQFGGSISTISRAVVILGFDTVRSVAITLMLFEHLQNKPHASLLRERVIEAFFTGLLGRTLAPLAQVRDAEESFICALFGELGKLLATFYFHEEVLEIDKLTAQSDVSESQAAMRVLGITYEELGVGVAKAWHFPDKLISAMHRLTDRSIRTPAGESDRLRVVSNLASELRGVVSTEEASVRRRALGSLPGKYRAAVPASERQLEDAVDRALQAFIDEAAILELDLGDSPLIRRVQGRSGGRARAADCPSEMDAALAETVLRTGAPPEQVNSLKSAAESEQILTAGVQDITNTLVSDFAVNDLLRMIVETMFRGMDFGRVMLAIRDARTQTMKGRFGLGKDVEALIKEFHFPLHFEPDVFHIALRQGVDILISDTTAESIKSRIPGWYRKGVDAPAFVIFPVIVDKKPIAMFYADVTVPGALNIGENQLSLLKTLRNQAVLAIRQRT